MNNDVVGLFFKFEIKWNIRSSVSAQGKNRTFIFLLLEGFASLKPAIIESPVINVVPLLLSSSVCMCANIGWGITISLLSSFAIPCSSLSVLLSASVFLFKLIFFFFNCFSFSVLSLLVVVPSMQKSVKSSFMGGTCSFISLLFSFYGKLAIGFSGVFSELLFFWLLLVIINDRSKTEFSLSSSPKKCTSL